MQSISNEIPTPPPVPKTFWKIAPVTPNIEATSNCNKTNILDKSIGLTAVSPAITPSIG